MRHPGSSYVVTVAVLGWLSAVFLTGCLAQGPRDDFSMRNNGIYYGGEPVLRHPRSILRDFAVDRMLKDNGFVRSIINCVLDKGPCESNGRKLRLMAPEILRGQCPGCSRTVHNQIRRVISHVQRNFPVEWSEVTRRFMSYNNSPQQDYAPPPPPPQHQQPPPQHQQVTSYNPDPNMYQNVYG